MVTKAAKLEVVISRFPSKIDKHKTCRPTVQLMEEILRGLRYTGIWQLTFNKQVTWRADERFKFLRRDGSSVRCRTKPGDNNTAWEIILSPPPGYVLDDVSSNLKSIHPKKLFVPQPTRKDPVALPADLGKPGSFLPHTTSKTTCSWCVEGQKPCPAEGEVAVFLHEDTNTNYALHYVACRKHMNLGDWSSLQNGHETHKPKKSASLGNREIEHQKAEAEAQLVVDQSDRFREISDLAASDLGSAKRKIAEWQNNKTIGSEESRNLQSEADKIANAKKKEAPTKPLAIAGHLKDLADEPDAISNALIAVAMVMDESGACHANSAAAKLTIELDLERFLSRYKGLNYKNTRVAANDLLYGLENNFCFVSKVSGKAGPGYTLTREGRQHLGELQESMPLAIVKRLFKGTPLSTSEVPEPTQPSTKDNAEDWLTRQLMEGSIEAKELRRRADQEGLTWSVVQKAKNSLGVSHRRAGFGKDSTSIWELHHDDEDTEFDEPNESANEEAAMPQPVVPTPVPVVTNSPVVSKIAESGKQAEMLEVVGRYQSLQTSIPEHDELIELSEQHIAEVAEQATKVRIKLEAKQEMLRQMQDEVDGLQKELDGHNDKTSELASDVEGLRRQKEEEQAELESLKEQVRSFLGDLV